MCLLRLFSNQYKLPLSTSLGHPTGQRPTGQRNEGANLPKISECSYVQISKGTPCPGIVLWRADHMQHIRMQGPSQILASLSPARYSDVFI